MRTEATLALLLLAASPAARAGDGEPGTVTRAPAVVEPATPEVPAAAREAGLSGEVVLELDLSAEGRVTGARVVAGAGGGLDEASLAAARRLRFSPAEIDGAPAAVTIEYRFRFEAPPPPVPVAALRGVVVERGTREPLAGVAVSAGDASAHTDRDGRFELPGLVPGKVKVVAFEPAHQRFETEEALEAGKAVEVRYYLRRAPKDAYEAVVIGERERKEVTAVALTAGEVGRIAGVSGDTVKVVQNLPGVARAPGGFGLLVVRGSNPTDTRVYVDGVEVPLVFHFGGLTSIVPSELVESVEFEAGNFGVRHGRATGGRIELRTRDPASRRLHLVADGNLFHAMAMAEGPAREDLAVSLAVRRSYADAVISAAARGEESLTVSVAPRYYDFQAKLAWRATPRDDLRLLFFGSDDRMELTGIDTGELEEMDRFRFGTSFAQAAASWDHRFSEAARARASVSYGVFDVGNVYGDHGSERDRAHLVGVRAEASRDFLPALTAAAGVDTRFVPAATLVLEFPEIPAPDQIPSPIERKIRTTLRPRILEAGLWAEATWRPAERLVVVPGLRAERVVFGGDQDTGMTWLDPRLAVRCTVREGTTVKAAAGVYHQPPRPEYVTREWGNPDLHGEGARHYMVGAEQRIAGPLSLDLQLYYKDLFGLALPSDAVVVRDGALVREHYTNAGTGEAYGAELLLRWNPGGRFFGWLSYSLSRSIRDQEVVGGTLMPGGEEFDQPHNLVAVGTLDLPELWEGLSLGFRLRWTSGNPFRRTVAAVYDADSDTYRPVVEASASGRAPDFLQLDLRADKRWTYRTWILSTYLEVQNATNRENPEGAAYNYDYSQQGWMTGLPLFPSFGLRAEY